MTNFNECVAKSIGRHFVSLSCVQTRPNSDEDIIHVFSGFVMAVRGEWFYITAGHTLKDVRAALQGGSTFDIWRFGDQTASNRFQNIAVPYAFNIEQWFVLEDANLGLDYATVHIGGICRKQLEAGGVTALDRNAWGDHLADHDYWALAGIPKESVFYDGKTIISAKFVVVSITYCEAPELAECAVQNKFYARLADDSECIVNDIDGMSGGPVFLLRFVDDTWKYKVIGVQSSWFRSYRIVAVCPVATFGEALEPIVQEALELIVDRGGTTSVA